jgi:hypothetical protein
VYHNYSDGENGYGWYSCDNCSNRYSEEACSNVGCKWIKDDNVNSGICISSSSLLEATLNLTCEMLLKEHCNQYINVNNTDIKLGINVIDKPCFFNRDDDSMNGHCVKKSSIEEKGCENIKTNSIIKYEGEERESCNEGHIIFGWSLMCGWVERYIKDDGYCGYVYFLSDDGFLLFSIFIFCFNLFIYLFFFFHLFIYFCLR